MTETAAKPELAADDFESVVARIDKALVAVEALSDDAKMHALGLKTAIEDLHKLALTEIVKKLKSDERGRELLFELVDEPVVYALLLRHGIVRPNPLIRINQVLEAVRPYMQSHGGDVEFVSFEDSTVFVRLMGSCNGCSQSAVTLRDGVEEALLTNVPEVKRVEVVPNDPGPSLIQIESRSKTHGWVETFAVGQIAAGTMKCFRDNKTNILIVNIENRLSAYRNECPHQGMPLDGGMLDDGILTCPSHGFKFDAVSGECLTAPAAQLEVFPLRVDNGKILVRAF